MSKKKVTKKSEPEIIKVESREELMTELQKEGAAMFDLREHNLREKYVMMHGVQGGLLSVLGLCAELGQRGASAMTIVRTIDALHDDWLMKREAARDELATHTCEEPANLPCLDCGGPTADCAGEGCKHHDHDHDDDDYDDDAEDRDE